jgi:hypothetical protein
LPIVLTFKYLSNLRNARWVDQGWSSYTRKNLASCSKSANKSSTSLIQSWYSKNVTRLTTQGCNNIVISWLY